MLFASSAFAEEPARLELWLYKTQITSQNYSEQAQFRYYQPFSLPSGWTGLSHLSFTAGEIHGPKFPNSPQNQWEPGNTRWQLSATSPNFTDNLSYMLGLRLYSPIGNPDPAFNAGQWEAGPTAALVWKNKNSNFITKFAPTLRYMAGFDDKLSKTKPVKIFEFLPEMTIKINDFTNFLLYQHNGLVTNERNGHTVIPFDAQIEFNINKEWSYRIGSTTPIYDLDHKQLFQLYTSFVYKL